MLIGSTIVAEVSEWMTAEQAASRLGIKPQTLYAYVSRGLVQSQAVPGPRRARRYNRSEIERLAQRRRSGGRAGGLELLIDTEITLLEPAGRLYYRGWDATHAARTTSYERVAEWLWVGEDEGEPPAWVASAEASEIAAEVTTPLPPTANAIDHLRVAAAAIGTSDPLRGDRRPEAVAIAGRSLIATLVDCLPIDGRHRPKPVTSSGANKSAAPVGPLRVGDIVRKNSLAARLWSRIVDPATERSHLARSNLTILNTALTLLADHELAASTLAARVAASTWADPYLVVLCGLGALGGPLHGGASAHARLLLEEVAGGTPATMVIGRRLAAGDRIPGFGHAVYRRSDPRAVELLDQLDAAWSARRDWKIVAEVLDLMEERELPAPNVDFALAAYGFLNRMDVRIGEVIFAIARCAGWLAHAIEEYGHRLRYRPRAVYTGQHPSR